MSSSMKRRRRDTGVANTRMKVRSERKVKRDNADVPQDDGVDGIAMQTQRRSTTYSRARGQV